MRCVRPATQSALLYYTHHRYPKNTLVIVDVQCLQTQAGSDSGASYRSEFLLHLKGIYNFHDRCKRQNIFGSARNRDVLGAAFIAVHDPPRAARTAVNIMELILRQYWIQHDVTH